MEPRELLLKHLPVIEGIVASISRRNGLDADAAEEFAAEVRLRLVSNDYAILRAFQGRSRFETYIAAVVQRLLIDHRNHQFGKWHASAEAERLGDVGTKLERLLFRDGRTLDESLLELNKQYPHLTYTDVEAIASRLPARMRRKRVSLDEAAMVHTSDVARPEHSELAAHVSSTISDFINQLGREDQLILRLRFDAEMTVSQIARALHIDQQVLYRRLYRQFGNLRAALVEAGITASDVERLIGDDSTLLDFRLKEPHGTETAGWTAASDKESNR